MHRIYLLTAVALAATGCAPLARNSAQAQEQRACFWASEVTGFSDAGPDRALVNIGSRETWDLTLSPGCPDVDWAMKIAIRPRSGERICPGRPAELLVPNASGSGFQSCLVRNVRRLSPAEAAAARGEARQE